MKKSNENSLRICLFDLQGRVWGKNKDDKKASNLSLRHYFILYYYIIISFGNPQKSLGFQGNLSL